MMSIPSIACLSLLSLAACAADLPRPAGPVLSAMKAELEHSWKALQGKPAPPYFLSYQVTEVHGFQVAAKFGVLFGSAENRARWLDVDVRVGTPALDNTHALRGLAALDLNNSLQQHAMLLAAEDEPPALRSDLWLKTDASYRKAVEDLGKVKTNMKVKVAEDDPSPDFSPAPAVTELQPLQDLTLVRKAWEDKLRRYSLPFAKDPALEGGVATLQAKAETRYYVNTEGTLLQLPQITFHLAVAASIRAKDGMVMNRYATFFATTPEGLPSDSAVLARVDGLIKELLALRDAPVTDPYVGPALLSGRAAAVFFHEVLGHRVEGHRQKGDSSGQTLRKMVGQELLPDSFSVSCDPTLATFGSEALAGHYLFDDEGVRARKVSLIDRGLLQGFLMGRMPIEGFPASNGHGRKAIGLQAVSRQSVLVVNAAAPVTKARLKAMLLERVLQEGKPYGLLIDDIEGGFTLTGRVVPNAFNVRPLVVYRVYADGREELVRGVDLIGTPLQAFHQVLAADDEPRVFNGVCGAESGSVPVSAIAPGILLGRLEVQKKDKNQDLAPILPAPTVEVNHGH
jgi:predicted Zn-dependent protease